MVSISLTSLVIDGAVILMLGAVLVVAHRLSRRFAEIRKGQTELADLVSRLERASGQAQEAIGRLKEESREAQESLQSESKKARGLIDELTVITEAGDNLASRLDRQFSEQRRSGAGAGAGGSSPRSGRPELLHVLKEAR